MTWRRVPLRKIAKLGSGHTPSRTRPEYWENCTIAWFTLADVGQLRDGTTTSVSETKERISKLGLARSAAELHPAGTVILSRTASVGFTAILGEDMATSQDFATWTCGPALTPQFLLYALRGLHDEILSLRMGSTHQTIYMPDIQRITVPLPPLPAQRAITNLLDAETARIDALITKKRHLAVLGEERWKSLVRLVATDSDWPVVPLCRLWRIIDCKHRTPAYVEGGYPVVSPGDVTPGRLDLRRCHRFINDEEFLELAGGDRRPRRGDVVYSRNASIGLAAYVDTDESFTMGQDVCLIRSENQSQNQLWLTYMLNSVGIDQLQAMKIGSTFDRVNIDQLRSLMIPAPPTPLQSKLARQLDETSRKFELLRGKLLRQIALLQEHRQALITAAVTGEIEILEVAA